MFLPGLICGIESWSSTSLSPPVLPFTSYSSSNSSSVQRQGTPTAWCLLRISLTDNMPLEEECHKIIFSLNTHKTRAPARAPEPNSQNDSMCLSVFSGNSLNINKCPRMTLCYPPYSESFTPYLYIYKSFPSRKPGMLWYTRSLPIIPYSRRSTSSLRRQWQLLHMSLPTLLSISYPPVMMRVGWGTTLKHRFGLQKSSVCQPGKF